MILAQFSPRVTNYLNSGGGTSVVYSGSVQTNRQTIAPNRTAAAPNAEITDVIIRAISGNAAVTVGADELHVYSMATS